MLSLKHIDKYSLDVRAVSSERLNDKLYLVVNSNHDDTADQLKILEKDNQKIDHSKIQIIYTPSNSTIETKLYGKRWLILIIFSFISLISAFNWIEYNIIQDVVVFYYNQSLPSDPVKKIDAINWFSMVYMLCYIPLVFPAMFLLESKGLKLSCSIGAFLTLIGCIIKCFAVNPNSFYLAMAGQTFCAIGQSFTLGIPARLSALWFGPNEIALATSVFIIFLFF